MNCETKKSTFGILVPFRCHFILSSIQFGMAQQLCYTFVSIVCHGWIGESSKWHLEDLVDAHGLCANIGVEEWESEREGGQKHTQTQNWIIQIANRKSYTHSTRIPWISAVFSGISAFFSFIWSHRMKAKTYPPVRLHWHCFFVVVDIPFSSYCSQQMDYSLHRYSTFVQYLSYFIFVHMLSDDIYRFYLTLTI